VKPGDVTIVVHGPKLSGLMPLHEIIEIITGPEGCPDPSCVDGVTKEMRLVAGCCGQADHECGGRGCTGPVQNTEVVDGLCYLCEQRRKAFADLRKLAA